MPQRSQRSREGRKECFAGFATNFAGLRLTARALRLTSQPLRLSFFSAHSAEFAPRPLRSGFFFDDLPFRSGLQIRATSPESYFVSRHLRRHAYPDRI